MRKPNVKDFRKASEVCRSFDSTISFGYTGEGSEVDVDERAIVIDLEETKSMNLFWSLVFHELGHIWCFDNDKYVIYHTDSLSEKEMAKYMHRNGLRIERYVDKIGKRLAKEYGMSFRYVKAYESKENIEWYRNWLRENYPL